MRRLVLLFVPLLALLPVRAEALSVRDIIELTKAHLGEEVLVALIEVDRSAFPIDAATIKSLKEAGVSEKVILAMIRSERGPVPAAPAFPEPEMDPPPAPEPQVIVIDHHDDVAPREVQVAYPIYIPVVQRSHRQRGVVKGAVAGPGLRDLRQDVIRPDLSRPNLTAPNFNQPAQQRKPAQPVYWGNGGKLRPDAWKPGPDGKD